MLIIFDFDGTIREISWEGLYLGYRAIIIYKNKKVQNFFGNLNGFKKWFSPHPHKNLNRIDPKIIKNKTELDIISKIFHSYYDRRVNIFPWVEPILTILSKKHKLAILSLSNSQSIKNALSSNKKIEILFDLIVGSDQAEVKPSPDGIFYIVNQSGIDLSNTLIIGDTDMDILAGKNAGTKTGIVKWGIGNWGKLLKLEPNHKFIKPTQLLDI